MMEDPAARAQTRTVLGLIAAGTALRLGFAWATGLGVDESYMVAAGRQVAFGYFDHPPLAWWLSWGAARLLDTEAAVAVRLPFILLFALSSWLMYCLGRRVADARAGFWAVVALNLAPVFGVTTGTWVLPDGPLTCALLAATLLMLRAIGDPHRPAPWIGAGACAGLALASKYSAILSIAGAGLFLLTSREGRSLLRRPGPWLAVLAALVIFAPVIGWNAAHGWASFAFQGERAMGLRLRPLAPFESLAGSAAFVLPWLALPMLMLGGVALWRGDVRQRLLAWMALPPILGFALVAAWSSHRVLFHWAAPGYLMLFPLLGRAVAERSRQAWLRRTVAATAAFVLAACAVVAVQLRLDPLGPAVMSRLRKDPTAEGLDWTALRSELDARGLLPPGTVVGVANWRDGGKLAIGLGPGIPVTVLHRDARQFGLVSPASVFLGRDLLVLIVAPATPAAATIAPLFAGFAHVADVPIRLRGRVVAVVAAYRGATLLRPPS